MSVRERKLLLVDDEPQLLEMVRTILADDGFGHVVTAGSAAEALAACRAEKPELALLDVMLPDGDGFRLLEEIRRFSRVPVIFLTARDEPVDRVAGLGRGADDYIAKPFLPRELLLRVHAVLRRCYPEPEGRIHLADCDVDFERAQVIRPGGTLPLTAREHALLSALARNAGRIVTIDALCEAIWGENPYGYENSLMAHVRRVREKIEREPSAPKSLLTVKGLGYRLIVEDRP
ncbi:MAG: response regulator transcription factor [Clostridia bacterium]|nr:response regulator transcription factor [Clostridia bacterium]